jgi:hypothetical protein
MQNKKCGNSVTHDDPKVIGTGTVLLYYSAALMAQQICIKPINHDKFNFSS